MAASCPGEWGHRLGPRTLPSQEWLSRGGQPGACKTTLPLQGQGVPPLPPAQPCEERMGWAPAFQPKQRVSHLTFLANGEPV